MADYVTIANQALNAIGHTRFISSLADASVEAQVVSQVYEQTRDEVLGAAPWPFAKRRATPSPVVGSARTGWAYLYLQPAECLTLRGVYTAQRGTKVQDQVVYEVENDATLGTIILSDSTPVELQYTAQLTNPSQFQNDFVQAYIWALAVKLATGLRKDPGIAQEAQGAYVKALALASAEFRDNAPATRRAAPVSPDPDAAICNVALGYTGHDRFIQTLKDPTPEAALCFRLYSLTRDELLRTHRWPWATRRAKPAYLDGATWSSATAYVTGAYVEYQDTTDGVTRVWVAVASSTNVTPGSDATKWSQVTRNGWAYTFLAPSDSLRIMWAFDGSMRNPRTDQRIVYMVENDSVLGEVIVSDYPTPEFVYVARVTDPLLYPPDFAEALAWKLAIKLIPGLRRDPKMIGLCVEGYARALAEASKVGLDEQAPDAAPTPSFIAARW